MWVLWFGHLGPQGRLTEKLRRRRRLVAHFVKGLLSVVGKRVCCLATQEFLPSITKRVSYYCVPWRTILKLEDFVFVIRDFLDQIATAWQMKHSSGQCCRVRSVSAGHEVDMKDPIFQFAFALLFVHNSSIRLNDADREVEYKLRDATQPSTVITANRSSTCQFIVGDLH